MNNLSKTRTLLIKDWKYDQKKKGNVLVRFAMRYTRPLTTQSRLKYLTDTYSKGWFTTKATPTGTNNKGEKQLLLTDIKNTQLISKVTNLLNEKIKKYGKIIEKERYRDDLKTVESVRIIDLTPKVEMLLKQYIERNAFHIKFNANYLDLGYIFTRTATHGTAKQGLPFVQTELSTFLRGGSVQKTKFKNNNGRPYPDINELVDFGRPIHILPHMFRHTFVSLMAQRTTLSVIREQVGHSEDSKELEKIYLHVTNKTKEQTKNALIDLEN
ncbi:MAG: hypothetical protein LBV67_03730 [Streptococcaceae bacterium]|nr:hypothetical protein [Streptococcaceae bacterium]